MEDTTIDKLLNLANINDLFSFIKEYAAKHAEFKEEFESYLKRECLSDDSTKAVDLRQDVLGAVDEEGRYHEWFSLLRFDTRLDEIAEDSRNLMELGNPEPALAVGVQIMEALGEVIEEYQPDDSDGYASDIYETAKELIFAAAKHPKMTRETLTDYFNEIENNSDIESLHDYGFDSKEELLLELALLVKSPEERLEMLDQFIASCNREYDLTKLVKQKIEALLELGRIADAHKTIQHYINLPQIRSMAVDNALAEKDYQKALSLIEIGITIAREDHYYGTERDWLKRKLEVYAATGERDKQIETAKELFVSCGFSMEYYSTLKILVPQREWKRLLFDTIDSASQKSRDYNTDSIAAIYIKESEGERLYNLVVKGAKTHIHNLDKYAEYLKKDHSEEILQIYNSKLRLEAAQGTGRDRYESIARSMKVMQKLEGGMSAAHGLAEFFRQTYRNRPAMMEIMKAF